MVQKTHISRVRWDDLTHEAFYRYVGQRLKSVRTKDPRKVTQQQLADAIGVTRASVANYESGNQAISVSSVYKAAVFFGVDLFEILPRQDAPIFPRRV